MRSTIAHSLFRTIAVVLPLTITCGCTTISIHNAGDASATVHHQLGLASITVSPGVTGTTIMRSLGIGATRTVTGLTIGAWSEHAALIADHSNCRSVIWIEKVELVKEVQRLLNGIDKSLHTICVITTGEQP